MSDFVFIIGAGASSHTGAPLMGNFLDKARKSHALGDDVRDHLVAELAR